MTKEQAASLVSRLLRGFPYLNPHDPEGYITALVQVMVEYPLWAGEQAINLVDEKNPEFPPSDRVLRTWLQEASRPYRYAAEWQLAAEKQIEERKQIEAARKEPQTYGEFKAEMAARGLPIDGKKVIGTNTVASIKQRFGITDEQWDAIPDLPPMMSDYWAGIRSS